jgi:hypothetical protein
MAVQVPSGGSRAALSDQSDQRHRRHAHGLVESGRGVSAARRTTTTAAQVTDTREHDFQHGSIYRSNGNCAHFVWGEIGKSWIAASGVASPPVTTATRSENVIGSSMSGSLELSRTVGGQHHGATAK